MSRLSREPIVRAGLLIMLVAFVLGARWAVISRFGSDLPEWDQWDAEGIHSLVPWFARHYTISELFVPQNEHRVVLTKLLNLGLTLANGQWDQRLECAVNAVLPALIAAGCFALGSRGLGRRWRVPLFVLLAAVFGLPLSWQNIVSGFHSQQFFLIGLSFAAIAWLPGAAPLTPRWWLGGACALLALVSMASGLFAAAVVFVLLLERRRRQEVSWAVASPGLALCAALVLAGWALRTEVAYHESLRAQSMGDFVTTLVKGLEWPGTVSPWLGLLFWSPICCLAWRASRRRESACSADKAGQEFGLILAGLGGWMILQLLATAYARGAGGPEPASRYVDTLAFGQAVNGMALGWLWEQKSLQGAARGAIAALGLVWAVAFGIGVSAQVHHSIFTDLPQIHSRFVQSEENVRNFLSTGREAYLQPPDIPYPSKPALLERIRIPVLRGMLPVSVRQPLEVNANAQSALFTEFDSRRGAGSSTAGQAPPTGLSPTTVPLANRITWGCFPSGKTAGTVDWESAPISPCGLGWLKFEVAGDLGRPGLNLELRDARSRAVLASIRPSKVPGDAWRTVYVHEPSGAFVIAAHVSDPRGWFGFAEPVEMGWLSFWAWRTVRIGLMVAEMAAGGAGLLVLGSLAGQPFKTTSPMVERPPFSSPKPDKSSLELTVLMPCLDEAETVGTCVEKAVRWLDLHGVAGEVIVADNGSSDGSQRLAEAAGARVVPVEPKGYGAALAGGIAAARGRFVIMADADDSYDFSRLEPFLEQLRAGNQLVVGNRFAGGIAPGAMPALHRYLGNPALSFVGRLFFRGPCRDFHCGLRGFDRAAIIALDLRTTGMEFASEMIVRAALGGLRLAEVPTTLSHDGRSRPPHLRSWRDGWRHLRFLLMYCPRWLFLLPGLTLMLAGLLIFLVLLPGPLRLEWGILDIHTLLAGATFIVIGYQAIVFAVFTKVFAITEGLLPGDRQLSRAFRYITLETGLATGAVLALLGIALAIATVWQWRAHGYGALNASATMRVFVPAMTLWMVGTQTIFSSFFLSILGLRRK